MIVWRMWAAQTTTPDKETRVNETTVNYKTHPNPYRLGG
jgi:hypothetical protein